MPDGLDCAYQQGQCNCAPMVPVGGPNPIWQCSSPQGCPEPRPRLGDACTQTGQSCDYGACTGGVAVVCKDGYWQQAFVPCPALLGQ